MKGKVVSGIMVTLLFIGMLTLTFNTQLVKSATTIVVPDDYPTIQEAINHAYDGDTIFVRAGTYYEHLTIDKSLSLIGENRSTTVIDGSMTGSSIVVTANNVMINGFTLQRSWYGISLSESSFNVISKNIISNTGYGISLHKSAFNKISQNTILNNTIGLVLLTQSSYNIIGKNIIKNNTNSGIDIGYSSYNTIIGNDIFWNDRGILLVGSKTTENRIVANRIFNNGGKTKPDGGVCLIDWPHHNVVYHNNFINNTIQARISGIEVNIWDDGYPSGGNYWSDYTTRYPDAQELDDSGIWDTPYVIDEDNQDNYPLMEPWTPSPPLPRTIDELKTEIEKCWSEGEIDNQGIANSLIVKLNMAQKVVDKGKIDEAKSILQDDFIPQVQNLSGIHITLEAADILIQSAEYIISHL